VAPHKVRAEVKALVQGLDLLVNREVAAEV
jgi:hypothetical protein